MIGKFNLFKFKIISDKEGLTSIVWVFNILYMLELLSFISSIYTFFFFFFGQNQALAKKVLRSPNHWTTRELLFHAFFRVRVRVRVRAFFNV